MGGRAAHAKRWGTIVALGAALAAALGGCGTDGVDGGLAGAAPPDVVFYAEADLKPGGDREAAVREILERFPGAGELEARIAEALEREARDEGAEGFDYEDDLGSWRGDRIAFFISDARGDEADGAFVLAAANPIEARASLDDLTGDDVEAREHRGVELGVDSDEDSAIAVHEGLVMLGNETGVKEAIDAIEGRSLADDDEFARQLKRAPDERLGLAYADVARLLDEASTTPSERAFFRELFGGAAGAPLLTAVTAEDDAVVLETVGPEAFATAGEGSRLLDQMPRDSWLAAAGADLGREGRRLVDLLAGPGGGREVERFERETGLDIERDVLGWMGDVAYFVRGTDLVDVEGGVLVEVTDRARAKRAINRIGTLAARAWGLRVKRPRDAGGDEVLLSGPELPEPILILLEGNRLAASYGAVAAYDVLDPGDELRGHGPYRQTIGSLGPGYEPGLYVSLQRLFRIAEIAGAGSDPDYRRAKPYLEPLGDIGAGTKREGDLLRTVMRIGIR